MELKAVYDELKQLKLCKSAYDFSVGYLGRDRSYYSVLKATNKEPSIEVLVMLDYALTKNVSELGNSNHPVIQRTHAVVEGMSTEIKQAISDKCRNVLQNQ